MLSQSLAAMEAAINCGSVDGALRKLRTAAYLMPVLHGRSPEQYVAHVRAYGFEPGAYVGVGSLVPLCREPRRLVDILAAIKDERPDLRLHGFGLKLTALADGTVQHLLESADAMAWSKDARKFGRANDYAAALEWCRRLCKLEVQYPLFY